MKHFILRHNLVSLCLITYMLFANKAMALVNFVTDPVPSVVLNGSVYTAFNGAMFKDGKKEYAFQKNLSMKDMVCNDSSIFFLFTETKWNEQEIISYILVYKDKELLYKVKTPYETIDKAYLRLVNGNTFVCISQRNEGTTFYKDGSIWQEYAQYRSPTSIQFVGNDVYWVAHQDFVPILLKNGEMAFNQQFKGNEYEAVQLLLYKKHFYYTTLNKQGFPELYRNDEMEYPLDTDGPNIDLRGILPINGHIYVYGHCGTVETLKNRACYWKDQKLIKMSKANVHSDVVQIFAHLNNIYVTVLEGVDNINTLVCKVYKNDKLLFTINASDAKK